MTTEIRRDTVKLGIDFRPIPVDVGDGIEWDFHPDPSPEQWASLMSALKAFTKFGDEDFEGEDFRQARANFTQAMSELIVTPAQQKKWGSMGYGLRPQQAIANALMEIWTGFPTNQPSPSGKGSRATG